MTYDFSIPFLFVPAVAVGSAGGKGVLPHKICHAARFAHGVVQMAQSRGQVVQSQLLHQHTDAAFGKASFVAAAVRVFVKLHVPRIGVAVGRFQGSGGFHGGNILWGKFAFSALTAEPLHGRCHHGFCIVIRQPVHLRALRHGENECPDHGAVDKIHFETVCLFKLRQIGNNFSVFCSCFFGDILGCIVIIAEYGGQLVSERWCKQCPHPHGHSCVFHCLSPNPIFTICIFIPLSPTLARNRKKPLTEGSFKSLYPSI